MSAVDVQGVAFLLLCASLGAVVIFVAILLDAIFHLDPRRIDLDGVTKRKRAVEARNLLTRMGARH